MRFAVHDSRPVERSQPLAASAGVRPASTDAVSAASRSVVSRESRRARALLPFVAIVVGLSLLLLTAVFRSVVVPLKAAVGFLLSVGASLGLVVALFQWGWLADALGVPHTGPVVSFLPIILTGVLFGLAMDYPAFAERVAEFAGVLARHGTAAAAGAAADAADAEPLLVA